MPLSKSIRSSPSGFVVDTRRGTAFLELESFEKEALRSLTVDGIIGGRTLSILFCRGGNWISGERENKLLKSNQRKQMTNTNLWYMN